MKTENGIEIYEETDNDGIWWRHKYTKQLHRDDGPAHISRDKKTHAWFRFGKLHRVSAPAITVEGTGEVWCQYGKKHREDGPAVVKATGKPEWWLNDHLYLDAYEWAAKVLEMQNCKPPTPEQIEQCVQTAMMQYIL